MCRNFESMSPRCRAGFGPLGHSRRAMKKENQAQPRKLVVKVSGSPRHSQERAAQGPAHNPYRECRGGHRKKARLGEVKA